MTHGPIHRAETRSKRLKGFAPVVVPHTRLLILGSFPSVRSLGEGRYYAHPQNQFWRLLQAVLGQPGGPDVTTMAPDARLDQLLAWGLGLWDVYASCERSGSLDIAIRQPELNDFVGLARGLPQLAGLAFNGGESHKHHRRVAQQLSLPMWRLPSSSPANASWSFERKVAAWREVFAEAGLPVVSAQLGGGGADNRPMASDSNVSQAPAKRATRRAKVVLPDVSFSEDGERRYLHLGTPWVQGSMKIKSPFDIDLEYVQRMMAWLLFTPLDQVSKGHAMQLGLGAGAITKFCHKRLRMCCTVFELNPAVLHACRGWFKLPADGPKLHVILGDAGQAVQDPQWLGTVEALAVDLYDDEAAAPVLDSEAFYRDCRGLLSDNGCMTVNLFGRSSSYERSLEKIVAAFGEDAVWAFKPTREGNTVVLAQRTPSRPKREQLVVQAEAIEARWALPATKWLRVFKPLTKSLN